MPSLFRTGLLSRAPPAWWTKLRALFGSFGEDLDDLPFVEDDQLRLRVACALVIDAQHGWPAEHRLDNKALQVWELYHTMPVQLCRYLNIAAYLSIAFAETPGWCVADDGSKKPFCSDEKVYARYGTVGLAVLPHQTALGLEAVCLLIFCAMLAARLFMLGVRRFLRSRWHLLQLVLLGFMFSDVAMAASPILWRRTHFTRPMRAVFIVCSHRKLRDTMGAVVLMMPRMLELLVLFLAILVFFAGLASLLFTSSPWKGATTNFNNFGVAFYSLTMLLTSTNFPDVALPAYRGNHWAITFFIIFQVGCVFCGLNVCLALVYRSYCAHMRAEARALSRNRRHAMRTAYRQVLTSIRTCFLAYLPTTHTNL